MASSLFTSVATFMMRAFLWALESRWIGIVASDSSTCCPRCRSASQYTGLSWVASCGFDYWAQWWRFYYSYCSAFSMRTSDFKCDSHFKSGIIKRRTMKLPTSYLPRFNCVLSHINLHFCTSLDRCTKYFFCGVQLRTLMFTPPLCWCSFVISSYYSNGCGGWGDS